MIEDINTVYFCRPRLYFRFYSDIISIWNYRGPAVLEALWELASPEDHRQPSDETICSAPSNPSLYTPIDVFTLIKHFYGYFDNPKIKKILSPNLHLRAPLPLLTPKIHPCNLHEKTIKSLYCTNNLFKTNIPSNLQGGCQ